MVNLRDNANLSTGGLAADVTDRVHETIRLIAERAARAIGLDICGIDFVLPDIEQPFSAGGIVEVNAAPGLRMHEFPTTGTARRVGAEIVRMLYPSGNGRIPIVSITGTNGKTTTTRLIAHVMGTMGKCVGMTSTDGIWIGGRQVAAGDTTGPRSAATVLSDPEVELAVLETARGGIVRNGLGYDWSDVGVMTNIHPDHIGQDGIRDEDDILRIKSLVAERVREGGVLILNADDPLLAGVPERPKVKRVPKQIVWFSLEAANPVVQDACRAGGTGYVLEKDVIWEIAGSNRRHILDAASLPLTFYGTARFQIANVMAAVAACRALGAGVAQIRARLRSFKADQLNSGRVNLYSVRDGHVLLDYGHNTKAVEAIAATATAWGPHLRTCVLGLPGDRADSIIEDAARTVGRAFQRVVIREDCDLRGRKPGELAGLIAAAIRNENPDADVEVVLDELQAVGRTVARIESGELIVLFCDQCEAARELLQRCGARPASSFKRREMERVLVA
jgi:cyanophycin synthetase